MEIAFADGEACARSAELFQDGKTFLIARSSFSVSKCSKARIPLRPHGNTDARLLAISPEGSTPSKGELVGETPSHRARGRVNEARDQAALPDTHFGRGNRPFTSIRPLLQQMQRHQAVGDAVEMVVREEPLRFSPRLNPRVFLCFFHDLHFSAVLTYALSLGPRNLVIGQTGRIIEYDRISRAT